MPEARCKTSTRRVLLVHPAARNLVLRRHKVAELLVKGHAHPELEDQSDHCRRERRRPYIGGPTALETNCYNIVNSTPLKMNLGNLLRVIKRFMKMRLASIRFITTFHKRYKLEVNHCLKLKSIYVPRHSRPWRRTRTSAGTCTPNSTSRIQ